MKILTNIREVFAGIVSTLKQPSCGHTDTQGQQMVFWPTTTNVTLWANHCNVCDKWWVELVEA